MLYFGTPISLTQTPERLLSLTIRDIDEALIAIARTDSSNIVVPNNREESFRLKRWHVDRRELSLILHARAYAFCVTPLFPGKSG